MHVLSSKKQIASTHTSWGDFLCLENPATFVAFFGASKCPTFVRIELSKCLIEDQHLHSNLLLRFLITFDVSLEILPKRRKLLVGLCRLLAFGQISDTCFYDLNGRIVWREHRVKPLWLLGWVAHVVISGYPLFVLRLRMTSPTPEVAAHEVSSFG